MSTPNQGPETAARPGLSDEALKSLGPMTPAQQQAMNHVVNAVKAVAPMINAVAKCIRGIRNTFARISQAAQRLTSTDRALNQSQGGRHRADGSTAGRQAAAGPAPQAGELSAPVREATVQARDRGRSLARDAGRALVNGTGKALASAGRWAWSKMQAGKAAAGEQVAKQVARGQAWANEKVTPLVQAADNKLSQAADWTGGKVDQAVAYGNQQMSRAAARASAALAAFAVNRSDPSLTSPDQALGQKAQLLAISKAIEAVTVPQDQRAARLAEFVELAGKLPAEAGATVEKPGGPAVEAGAQSVAASQHAAWVLGPNADANSIRPPAATGQATPSAAESAPGLHTKKEGPESTQTRD
ncbi:hypothetical protein [Kribbella italica]|uniref:Uncharacterized protein n=1 Tax=Kribbella italica TaxID=1540520 RepID=A0A7W9J8H3_9ACTN|nr:hypothetical protein [Kribbella italica]MBB5837562.1 hypothetical protein [Kribbella italica]